MICDDLFFKAKVKTTAKNLEKEISFISDKAQILENINKSTKIIIDLNYSKLDIIGLLKEIKETSDIEIIGYLSHIQIELKKEAEKYCTLVIPRSKFSEKLAEILA